MKPPVKFLLLFLAVVLFACDVGAQIWPYRPTTFTYLFDTNATAQQARTYLGIPESVTNSMPASTNIALLSGNNTFTGTNLFTGVNTHNNTNILKATTLIAAAGQTNFVAFGQSTSNAYGLPAGGGFWGDNGSAVPFGIRASGSGSANLYLDTNGYFGVGTALSGTVAPATPFHVVVNSGAAAQRYERVTGAQANKWDVYISSSPVSGAGLNNGSMTWMNIGAAADYAITTESTNAKPNFVIKATTGRVGIGLSMSSPGAMLQVSPGTTTTIGQLIKLPASAATNAFEVQDSSANILASVSSAGLASSRGLALPVAGNGISIKEGSNATMGVATLVAGTVTVSTTKVTANSRIFLTRQTISGTLGSSVDVTARSAGTSFTITSNGSVLDTSTVAWIIIEPN